MKFWNGIKCQNVSYSDSEKSIPALGVIIEALKIQK